MKERIPLFYHIRIRNEFVSGYEFEGYRRIDKEF